MLTIFIFFPLFYGISDGGIHFSIQHTLSFSIFSFLVKPLEQNKIIAFYVTLHHFQRLHIKYHPPFFHLQDQFLSYDLSRFCCQLKRFPPCPIHARENCKKGNTAPLPETTYKILHTCS